MTASSSQTDHPTVSVSGHLTRAPQNRVLRAVLTVTGLLLVQSAAILFARYILGLKAAADATLDGDLLRIETRYQFWGKPIRTVSTSAPLTGLSAVRLENRTRYLYLTVGFAALAAGVLLGMQWFLDGLHAGYPYLTAAGALVIVAGAAADAFLYFFIPPGAGRSRLLFVTGPWIHCIRGADPERVAAFVTAVELTWKAR